MKKSIGFRLWAAALILGTAALALGCSKAKKSVLVAKVGQEEISADEIGDILARQGRIFDSAKEEMAEKRRLLDSIVDARILIREAYRQKLDKDSIIFAFEKQERPLYLIDALYFREVRDKVRLSGAEVLRFYRALQTDRCYKQILASQKRVADSLLVLARKGLRFDSLAMAYSQDPFTGPRGGDIGCYGWSRKLPREIFERVVKMKPGEVAGPFQATGGWAVLQCYEERPAALPDPRVFEPELRNLIEPLREESRSAEFVAEVRKELEVRIVDSTARFVNQKQRELSTIVAPGRPARYSTMIRTNELTPAQRNMPLLVYKGGSVTAGKYLETIQGSMPERRLVLDTGETSRALLFQLVFRDAMAGAAAAKGLEKDREFLKLLRQAVEDRMALYLKYRIYTSVRLDSGAAKSYFDAHPDEFVQPAAVHLFEINRSRREELLTIKPNLRTRDQFLSAATRLTARAALRPLQGDLGWVEQHQYPELFAAAAKMKSGEIAGPVSLADSTFSLIYFDGRRSPHKQTFNEVKESLFERLLAARQDSVFTAWLSAQKKAAGITLYPDELQKTVDQSYYAKLKEWQDKLKEEGS